MSPVSEIVMEYRRKLASLTPHNKRIWELTHTMMNAMIRSENAGAQDHWRLCEKYHAESKKAEDELLDLLAGAAQTGQGREGVTMWQFADNHPFAAFFCLAVIGFTIVSSIYYWRQR